MLYKLKGLVEHMHALSPIQESKPFYQALRLVSAALWTIADLACSIHAAYVKLLSRIVMRMSSLCNLCT